MLIGAAVMKSSVEFPQKPKTILVSSHPTPMNISSGKAKTISEISPFPCSLQHESLWSSYGNNRNALQQVNG